MLTHIYVTMASLSPSYLMSKSRMACCNNGVFSLQCVNCWRHTPALKLVIIGWYNVTSNETTPNITSTSTVWSPIRTAIPFPNLRHRRRHHYRIAVVIKKSKATATPYSLYSNSNSLVMECLATIHRVPGPGNSYCIYLHCCLTYSMGKGLGRLVYVPIHIGVRR